MPASSSSSCDFSLKPTLPSPASGGAHAVALAVVAVEGVVLAVVAVERVELAVVAVGGDAEGGNGLPATAATIVLLEEEEEGDRLFEMDAWTMPHRSQPLSSLRKVAAESQSPNHLYFTCCTSTAYDRTLVILRSMYKYVREKQECWSYADT